MKLVPRGLDPGRALVLLGVLAACPGLELEPEPELETGSGPGTTVGEVSTSAEGPVATTTTAAESTTTGDPAGSPTTGSTGGTAPDDDTSSDTMPMSETGVMPPAPKLCSLEVIDPDADPTMVIDAGDGEGQIPTLVGEALLRNCGCHYTDDVPIGLYVDYSSNLQPLATLADFHGNFMGIFPMNFETMPAYLAVEQRVVYHQPLPMPPYGCGVEGEPGMISTVDLELLTEWLAAAAPDGASFP